MTITIVHLFYWSIHLCVDYTYTLQNKKVVVFYNYISDGHCWGVRLSSRKRRHKTRPTCYDLWPWGLHGLGGSSESRHCLTLRTLWWYSVWLRTVRGTQRTMHRNCSTGSRMIMTLTSPDSSKLRPHVHVDTSIRWTAIFSTAYFAYMYTTSLIMTVCLVISSNRDICIVRSPYIYSCAYQQWL